MHTTEDAILLDVMPDAAWVAPESKSARNVCQQTAYVFASPLAVKSAIEGHVTFFQRAVFSKTGKPEVLIYTSNAPE
jgi:hypothetical protein